MVVWKGVACKKYKYNIRVLVSRTLRLIVTLPMSFKFILSTPTGRPTTIQQSVETQHMTSITFNNKIKRYLTYLQP